MCNSGANKVLWQSIEIYMNQNGWPWEDWGKNSKWLAK